MKHLRILIAVIFLASCAKHEIEPGTPSPIESKILEFEKISCDKDANVKKYVFQSATVFVFDPGTCVPDMTSEVTDIDGNTLGFLGGIANNRVINNENFERATLKSVTWQK